jgi:hypothetical protein
MSRSRKSTRKPRKSYRRSPRKSHRRRLTSRSSCNSKKKLSLISIKRSPKKDKKYVATFCKNGHIKQTHFGAKGMSDYTKHKDKARKSRYINRHKSRENWGDATSAGALSRYILWGKPSFRESVNAYKRKFRL